MIKFTIEIEEYKRKDIAKALDHIARLVEDGYTEGEGWKLEGEENAYPIEEEASELTSDKLEESI